MKVKLPNFESSHSGAVFSNDKKYRYALWRTFGTGDGTLLIIGLNPSTADEFSNDPTIRRCIGFSKKWKFKTLVVTNLFAYRATQPQDLKLSENPVGELNNIYLEKLSDSADCTLAAWGVHGGYLNREQEIFPLLKNSKCLGITKHGYPRHPLYVRASQELIDYSGR